MAKADDLISPANLWGKPLPGSTSKPAKEKKEEKAPRMRTNEEDDDIDLDVDAELEEDAVLEDDNEAAYVEAAELEESDATEDEDETEYEPEEGDEVVDESDDEVDSVVESDKDDDPTVSAEETSGTKKKVNAMADKKSGADHIREEIERRQESGDSLRGVDIVAALAKKRVVVSPAQVSQLLKKAGVKPTKRGVKAGSEEKSFVAAKGKRVGAAEAPRVTPKHRAVESAPSKTTMLPMGQLKAATAFLEACDGCYDTAGEILTAHKQLGAMMSR
jgi:hypothetical protein